MVTLFLLIYRYILFHFFNKKMSGSSSDDEQFDVELDSDDDIAIILNVHLPQESMDRSSLPENFHYNRAFVNHQFQPTNPVSHPLLKFTPIDPENEDKEEPRPWRDNPKCMPDYFNYGFTEKVWEAYKYKQLTLRRLFSERNQNQNNRHRNNMKKNNMDHHNNFNKMREMAKQNV